MSTQLFWDTQVSLGLYKCRKKNKLWISKPSSRTSENSEIIFISIAFSVYHISLLQRPLKEGFVLQTPITKGNFCKQSLSFFFFFWKSKKIFISLEKIASCILWEKPPSPPTLAWQDTPESFVFPEKNASVAPLGPTNPHFRNHGELAAVDALCTPCEAHQLWTLGTLSLFQTTLPTQTKWDRKGLPGMCSHSSRALHSHLRYLPQILPAFVVLGNLDVLSLALK